MNGQEAIDTVLVALQHEQWRAAAFLAELQTAQARIAELEATP